MKSAILLEDIQCTEDLKSTGDAYTKFERLFNSLLTTFLKGGDTEELIQRMFAHIKTQEENPGIP